MGLLRRREERTRRARAPDRHLPGHRPPPAWSGLCYTQLTDVEQEINGPMTYDRKPKFDVKRVKEINDLLP